MKPEDAAWLAGLFEGEGSVIHYANTSGPNTGRTQRRLAIAMTDHDVLEHARQVAGGTIVGPQLRGSHKPIWTWHVTNWPAIIEVAEAIRPWLGARRGARLDGLLADPPARIGGGRVVQSECKRGHPRIGPGADIYVDKKGIRHCRACTRERQGIPHERARGPRGPNRSDVETRAIHTA